ncbi:MAG: D-alanine--D-alanine ligase [Caldilineaceae bacterium SB0670_bin_27]|uniref:D-alanine--D-alanine ligase n=1 Tax=Caldilineaceae bacterium SB0664_bin_27 TaxID=2605260 RepID=A0A6B0YUP2_9CHLR|nr:D-alanine--D-alanine ligase [Caldilineaceae bacterium SB0664_bin_27]MYJ79192.1 D-alanine--D-alanine ligase [Caldilineaceae bacterium SB0670_bin_27]
MACNPVRVGVLFGGKSGEHEISLLSAQTVIRALDEAGYETVRLGITKTGEWLTGADPLAQLTSGKGRGNGHGKIEETDSALLAPRSTQPPLLQHSERLPAVDLIFPVLHGPYGEDGTVQGLLEMLEMPYVGCGVLASAVAMDKISAKALFAAAGIPQVAYRTLLRRNWTEGQESDPDPQKDRREKILDELESALAYPLFVKPANLGSSVGISKVRDRAELSRAIGLACRYDRKVLVEEGVHDARELEVSVLGNDEPRASIVGEVVPANEFYDYEAKYLDKGSRLLIPADISSSLADEIRLLSVRAFQALDGAGLARADFLLGAGGQLYLNELNTMPGFTASSMYPKLWEASGVPLTELVGSLVDMALERHADRQQNRIHR